MVIGDEYVQGGDSFCVGHFGDIIEFEVKMHVNVISSVCWCLCASKLYNYNVQVMIIGGLVCK